MSAGDDAVSRARAEPVELVDYDPGWPEDFSAEAAHLRHLLASLPIGRIEHIGSTAVPGLSGKPIVDLMVEVPDYETVRQRIAPILRRAGYEFFWRPVTPGDVEIDYAWFLKRDAAGRRSHHVHMAPPGSRYWDRVTFRDRLRADPTLAADYASVKRAALTGSGGDRAAYARAKGGFIRRVLAGE
jgi:GrpB-like predicted nucleotidyltransferase (UPF0157 family)